MQSRLVRVVLPAIVLIAGAGMAAWSWHLAQRVTALHQTADTTFARVDRLQEWLDAVADQELLYVSSGRVDRQTMEATSSLLRQIASDCAALAGGSLSMRTSAVSAVNDVGTALAEIIGRTEANLRAGLDVTAADLAFTETQPLRRSLRQAIRAVRATEAAALAEARSEGLTQAWVGLGGVALLLSGVLLVGARTAIAGAQVLPSDTPASIETAPKEGRQSAAQSDDLLGVADLCTRIGQLRTESDLPGLLERAGVLLGASGLIVWMGAGEELFAASGVGYEPGQLGRLGPIPREAANATATAWRTGVLQTVASDGATRAALAAPLHGSTGCIGVLALELDAGREHDGATRACARLIAAQLGTVLAPGPAASSEPPADVLPFERSARA
jgi:hypothetical protein